MNIKVTSQTLEEIRQATAAAHPREACGLLVGCCDQSGIAIVPTITRAVETRNTHPTPETHFEVEPQALIDAFRAERDGGPSLMGYFHSHPGGAAEPSATDQAMAPGDGRIWAVAAGSEVRFWKDAPGGFEPLSYTVERP